MSKKQQYTTKFYEGNGGVIDAVTRDESGKVVNVLSGFEADPGTGLSVLAAARENWPYADPFESYQWGGKTMEEVAEELEKMEYHPEMGDLIAETKATPDHYTDAQYIERVEFNWSRMGAAGHELFKDLDVPEAVAYRIKLVLVYKCRQKKLNSLYYKKKEQRRCSTWRKIKNRILRNSSNRSSISTMPEVPHILNWNMNMA